MKDFVSLYEKYNKKQQLNEFENNWKKGFINAKYTRPRFFWEFKLFPATMDIEFNYKVSFNKNKIKEDFSLEGDKVDYDAFYSDVIEPIFLERSVRKIANTVPIPGFKTQYVTYGSGEITARTLDPSRKLKYHFSHIITVEAKDQKKIYTKKEIEKIVTEFVKKLEPKIYAPTKYFTISKT